MQAACMASLISAFVVQYMEVIVTLLAIHKISTFYSVAVPEQTSLSLTLWETPKTGFLATRPNWYWPCFESYIQNAQSYKLVV